MGASRLTLQAVACLFCAVTPLSAQTAGQQIEQLPFEQLPLNPRPFATWGLSDSAPAPVLVLPQGTPVCLEFTNYISTRTAKRNDRVRFRVSSEVRVEGVTIIPIGAEAWGIVTVARKPRHFSLDGRIEIALQSVTLVNGRTVSIQPAAVCRKCAKWDWRASDSLQGPLLIPVAAGILAMMPREERNDLLTSMMISKGNHAERLPGTRLRVVISAAVELNREEFSKLQPPEQAFSSFLSRSAPD